MMKDDGIKGKIPLSANLGAGGTVRQPSIQIMETFNAKTGNWHP